MTKKKHASRDVTCSLHDAIRDLPSGATVAIGGSEHQRRPLALVRELTRLGFDPGRLLSRSDGPEGTMLGTPLEVVPAGEPLKSDVLLLHADAATEAGDVLLAADPDDWFADRELAYGTRQVIASVEQLVSNETAISRPRDQIASGERVVAVVHTPYGSHPLSFPGRYPADAEFAVAGPDVLDHWAYLDAVGFARLTRRATIS